MGSRSFDSMLTADDVDAARMNLDDEGCVRAEADSHRLTLLHWKEQPSLCLYRAWQTFEVRDWE